MVTFSSTRTDILQSYPLALYAPGEFGKTSKTAEGVIRYGTNPIACVIDPSQKGRSIKEVVGIESPAPIVASVEEAAQSTDARALLLGTAWSGGALPQKWLTDIKSAIRLGWPIINGLHDFLEEMPEIKALAREHQVELLDIRKPPENLPIASGKCAHLTQTIVLTVGSDCTMGKMTTALALNKLAQTRGLKSGFVATGQTGIMIAGGKGIAIDRVIGDFMAGAVESMVLEASQEKDLIFVEGQGSLAHPGFSGVTLALLHGACPQLMVLCHRPTQQKIKGTDFPLSDLNVLIKSYENMAQFMRPSKVAAIALDTRSLSEAQARETIAAVEKSTGLPATDPVRFGAEKLLTAIEKLTPLSTSP